MRPILRNKIRFFLFVTMAFCVSSLISTQNKIDSLKNELSSADSKNKMGLYNELSKALIYSDTPQSMLYNDSLAILSEELGNEEMAMTAKYNYSVLYRFTGDFQKSIDNQEEYAEYLKGGTDSVKMAMSFYQLGTAYVRLDNHEKAMNNLNQSLSIAERRGDKSLAFKVHNAIAIIYKNIYQNDKALEHYFKAVDMAGEIGDTASFALIYNGIGVVYTKLDSMETAERYFRQSLDIAEKTNNTRVMSFQYRNLGTINFEKQNYPEAQRLYFKALELREKMNDQLAIGGSHFDLGEVYLATNRIQDAEDSFAKALEIFQNLGALSSENSTYEKIAEVYEKKNDFRNALFYKNKYYSTRDSLKDNELREKINEIDAKYETSKKELEIQKQQKEIDKKTYQRNLLLSILSLAGLLAGVLIWGIWSRMKRNKKITEQEKAIQKEKINSLEKEKKLLSFASILEGQESERIRIAKDLHDGLGGLLTNVKAHFGRIQDEIKKVEELDVYNSACDMIDKAHEEVR
ncbi:MAG: tetratricopeptide repeat protein, partial [Saprospiraceae bacterium]|nr:tetratricopeptide repeat protein [Saprospiraceae bacterium]